MPRSAIAAGCVDFVLPPEGIAQELARLGRHPYWPPGEPRAPEPRRGPTADPEDEDAASLDQIFALLRKGSGADFTAYKKTTLRGASRAAWPVNRIETLDELRARTSKATRARSRPSTRTA